MGFFEKRQNAETASFPAKALLFVILVSMLGLGACATRPDPSDREAYAYYKQVNDPLEPLNRQTLKLNRAIETVIFEPVSKIYVFLVPKPARQGVTNFLHNLETPVILANDIMQGEGGRAWDTLRRFFINSTVGLGGMIDVAKRVGIPFHDEDFGQTLASHGVKAGPYIVLPILGPSNPRDGIGLVVDILIDPLFWIFRANDLDTLRTSRTIVDAVDTYSRHMDDIEQLQETSLDYYAALRSAYRQNRADEIRNGEPPPIEELDDDIFRDLDEFEEEEGEGTSETSSEKSTAQSEMHSLYSRYLTESK